MAKDRRWELSEFGDYEPEDAWHPDDTIEDQVKNLRKRLEALDLGTTVNHYLFRQELIYMLRAVVENGDRDNPRTNLLIEDIDFVQERLGV